MKNYVILMAKGFLWLALLMLALIAAYVGINLVDEDLSPEAVAIMDTPAPDAPTEDNGYIYFLGMYAPEGVSTRDWGIKVLEAYRASDKPDFEEGEEWKAITAERPKVNGDAWCNVLNEEKCQEKLNQSPELLQLLQKHATFLSRYREARDKPIFLETYLWSYLRARTPSLSRLGQGQKLSLLAITDALESGGVEWALAELGKEITFHRRILAGARWYSTKSSALTLLEHDLLFLSGLLRSNPGLFLSHKSKIAEMLQPLAPVETKLDASLENEARYIFAILPAKFPLRHFISFYSGNYRGDDLDSLIAWAGYRHRATANGLAKLYPLHRKLVDTQAVEFSRQIEDVKQSRSLILQKEKWHLMNPTGYAIMEVYEWYSQPLFFRIHDLSGLLSLVALQTQLHGIAGTTDAVTSLLSGEMGKRYADPYTNKPMQYDATAGTLSFEPRGDRMREIKKSFGGRIAIRL